MKRIAPKQDTKQIITKVALGCSSSGQSNYLKRLGDLMDFPAGIPIEERERLLKQLHPITVKKDDYFLRAGTFPNT
jgi:hypothetical protein